MTDGPAPFGLTAGPLVFQVCSQESSNCFSSTSMKPLFVICSHQPDSESADQMRFNCLPRTFALEIFPPKDKLLRAKD